MAGEGHAVVDPHSFGVVDFHDDAVVGRDDQVGQEIVFADEPVGDELFYGFFTDQVSVGGEMSERCPDFYGEGRRHD